MVCFEYLIELGGGDVGMSSKAEVRGLRGAGRIAERRPCITEACVPGVLERQRQLRFHTCPILEQNSFASVNGGR